MKINGTPEGGQGGGLTPQQLAILNSVPNKVNQVRLVTDGSVIRHEGALTPLTFSQIYDLVMDNSKYVYIVMDNNIRFRPSAYDGNAIWFDSSFIEEGKPNILRCIINSDNRVDITQIVVASEEYVDEKVAEAGGLDPEQKKAVNTLVNSSKGMLYTEDLAPRHINRYDFEGGTTRLVNLDGRIIFNRYSELYEFKDLGIHYLGPIMGQFDYNYAMWTDMSGRIYCGTNSKIYLDTMTAEPADLGGIYYNYQENRCNIFKGQNAVYMYGGNQYQVFDEEAQQFGEEQMYSNDENLDVYSFMMNQIQFGDRVISIYNGQTYELVEDADGIHPEVINNPFDFDSAPFTVEGKRMFYIEGTWYYMPTYPYEGTYRLVDGTWEQMEITYPEGATPYFEGYGVVADNMVINHYSSHLNVYNLTDKESKVTSWAPVGNAVVDLESNQNIGGSKYFKDAIQAPGVLTGSVGGLGNNLDINATYDINLNAFNGFVKLPANTMVDGDPAASKSDTIQSSQLTFPGKMRKTYDTIQGSSERQYYFTFNNKLYNNSYTQWIFDGETAVDASELFPSTYIDFQHQGKATSDRYFLCYNGLYELVDDEFVLRMADSIYEASWIFPYEDTLVNFNGGQKLNTSTWEWEEWLGQQISGFTSVDRVFELNGVTYSTNDYNLSIFNPDTSSFEVYMDYVENGNQYWSNGNHFIHNGHIYVWMAGSWFILDLENRTLIREPDVTLNGETTNGVFSINGRTYTNENNVLNMLYNVEYTKPEVPESDGTYVLKATRVGDQITYTWVVE